MTTPHTLSTLREGSEPTASFRVALDTLDAIAVLKAHHETVSAVAIYRQLHPGGENGAFTLAAIEQALARIERWQAQPLIRKVIAYRSELCHLHQQLSTQLADPIALLADCERALDLTEAILLKVTTPKPAVKPQTIKPRRSE
jgi:hypothetical protein